MGSSAASAFAGAASLFFAAAVATAAAVHKETIALSRHLQHHTCYIRTLSQSSLAKQRGPMLQTELSPLILKQSRIALFMCQTLVLHTGNRTGVSIATPPSNPL